MSTIGIRDFEKIKGIGGLSVSPDGRFAAYYVNHASVDENCYKTSLYLLDLETEKSRLLLPEGGAGFVFSDDSRGIIFPAMRNQADRDAAARGEELTVYYYLPLSGGEARELFRLDVCAQKLVSLGGDRWLVRHSRDLTRPDLSGLGKAERAEALAAWKKDASEFHVLDEIPFWFDGEGFTNKTRSSLSVFDRNTGVLRPLTAPEMDVVLFTLNADKSEVLFTGNDIKDWRINERGLYTVGIESGVTETLMPTRNHSYGNIAYIGDRIYASGNIHHDDVDLDAAILFTYDPEARDLVQVFDPDEEFGCFMLTECGQGGTSFTADGDGLMLISSVEYAARLNFWKPGDTAFTRLSPEGWNIMSFARAGDRILAVAYLSCGGLQEVVEVKNGEIRVLTSVNGDTFADAPKPERLSFTNTDGWRIDGWVIKPVGYEPGKKYPGVLHIHGGPRSAFCDAFSHEMQVFASRGYFVFFCNPRGGATRGDDFADIDDMWGTVDYQDVMEFTDAVLKAYPDVDENRLGVTGGSYGGFMTNWIIGHTDRFKAAVTCRSINYWTGYFGVNDLGGWYDRTEQGGTPWEKEDRLRVHSPLFSLCNAKTPTLILHSMEDYRCPVHDAYSLYYGLLEHGVETRMVLFKGESHGLSRTGKPSRRIRRLEEIFAWFEKYL